MQRIDFVVKNSLFQWNKWKKKRWNVLLIVFAISMLRFVSLYYCRCFIKMCVCTSFLLFAFPLVLQRFAYDTIRSLSNLRSDIWHLIAVVRAHHGLWINWYIHTPLCVSLCMYVIFFFLLLLLVFQLLNTEIFFYFH